MKILLKLMLAFSCLTNLSGTNIETVYIYGRKDTTTQMDFIKYIINC